MGGRVERDRKYARVHVLYFLQLPDSLAERKQ